MNQKSLPNSLKKILYLIEQAGSLMLYPRTHVRSLGNTFDTVSSHSHHVSIISYCLCRMEGLSHEEGMKGISMAIFHDLAEARTGDMDFVAKHYVTVDEKKAIDDQFTNTPFGSDLIKMMEEYEKRDSLVAKCTKDADSLAQMFSEWVLLWQGNKLAEKWFESDFKDRVPALKTESAKKLAFAMKDSNPHEWWWSQFMKDDEAIEREKLTGK